MGKKQRRGVWLFEPRWSFRPKAEKALEFFWTWKFLTFGFLLPMLINLALRFYLAHKYSEMGEEMPVPLFRSIAAVVIFLFVLRYGIFWIPNMISVDKWGIRVGNDWIKPPRMNQITIDARIGDQPSLIVERIPQAAKRFFNLTPNQRLRVGISQKISLQELTVLIRELFPTVTLNVLPGSVSTKFAPCFS